MSKNPCPEVLTGIALLNPPPALKVPVVLVVQLDNGRAILVEVRMVYPLPATPLVPCTIKLLPDKVTLLITAGVTPPLLTTLNTPLAKLKAFPAPGLPKMLAKLLALVAPAPLNSVKVWPTVNVPLVTMFSTPP